MLFTPYPGFFAIGVTALFVVVTLTAHVIFGIALGLYALVLLLAYGWRARALSRIGYSLAVAGAIALPRRQRLDGRLGYEPAVRPLGPGAIGVWQDPGARWGVAIERGGIFHRAVAPAGRGPSTLGEDFSYAYDLQAAGTHAVLAWVASDGSIRVSELS